MNNLAQQDKYPLKKSRKLQLIIITLISLLLGEWALQINYWLHEKHWLWKDDAFKVHYVVLVKDRRQYSLRPDFKDLIQGISVNHKGFRAPDSFKEPQIDQPVIVALGDSVPFGAGVKDDETYPYQLDKLLRVSGYTHRVINAGVPSYNMRQSLDRFKIDVFTNYHPQLVTIQAANDISLLTYYREKWNSDLTWADIRFSKWLATVPQAKKIATLYYLSKIFDQHKKTINKDSNLANIYAVYPDKKMLANLKSELEDFIAFCQSHSIPVVLLPIDPFYYQTSHLERNSSLTNWFQYKEIIQGWDKLIADYNDVLILLSNKRPNVYFFDTRKIMDRQNREGMYVDFIHYGAKGNLLITQELFKFLQENKLLRY